MIFFGVHEKIKCISWEGKENGGKTHHFNRKILKQKKKLYIYNHAPHCKGKKMGRKINNFSL
jgi:hypothetical protein